MKFPDKKRVLEVLKKIKRKRIAPTRLLHKNASVVDKIKFNICQKIIRFKRESGYSNKEIADIIGVTPAVTSRIIHCNIEKFKIDSLLSYYECLLMAHQDKRAILVFRKQLDEFLKDEDKAA